MILALAAVYGTVALISNCMTTLWLTDQWGRRKYAISLLVEFLVCSRLTLLRMILTGLAGIIVIEIYASVMQRVFQDTDNSVGKGFAILGIYLFVVNYCKR